MARDSSGTKNEPQYAGTGAPADAADLSEVASFAAFTGNRKVGPTTGTATGPGGANTGRTTSTGADVWEGLMWRDTTDGKVYEYRSGAWVKVQTGPFAIETSVTNVTIGATGATWIVNVSFTSGTFTQAPIVQATHQSAAGVARKLNAQATAITTSGFQLVVSTGDGTNPGAQTASVGWLAIQMTSAAAAGAA